MSAFAVVWLVCGVLTGIPSARVVGRFLVDDWKSTVGLPLDGMGVALACVLSLLCGAIAGTFWMVTLPVLLIGYAWKRKAPDATAVARRLFGASRETKLREAQARIRDLERRLDVR